MKKPTFKSTYHVEVLEGRGVILFSEDEPVLLKGELCERIAPLLDGTRTAEDIIHSLNGEASSVVVYYLLMRLEKDGYIRDAIENLSPAVEQFVDHTSTPTDQRLSFPLSLSIRTLGEIPSPKILPFFENHESFAIRESEDLQVIITDDYLDPDLAEVNRVAIETNIPWLLVKPVGKKIWVGPLFNPAQGACWQCLSQRIKQHRLFHSIAEKHDRIIPPLVSLDTTLSTTLHIALNLAANEVLRWSINRDDHLLHNKLVTFDTIDLTSEEHILTRRPQCLACGDVERLHELHRPPFELHGNGRIINTDGGHRLVDPVATYETYRHHVSPITGVVRTLRELETPQSNVHIFTAGHNLIPISDHEDHLPTYLRDQSSGKGRSREQARASALCEALERYSGVYQGVEPIVRSTLEDLGDRGIHPNACMHYSEHQYTTREAWHAECDHSFQRVPERFEETMSMDWTAIWSLTNEVTRYLPTAYCFYNYNGPHRKTCVPDSNGCAAGNTLEEAILQGFFELVERDGVGTWWYNRLCRPSVDLSSFQDNYIDSLVESYHTHKREIWVLDLTTDLQIPVFAAVSRRIDHFTEDLIFGFGAHFDARIAINRALTEMNQLLPFVSKFDKNGQTNYQYDGKMELKWWKTSTLTNQPYLAPSTVDAPQPASLYPTPGNQTIREDMDTCLSLIKNAGMDLLVLNQTRPDIGLPVVKVIVPQMRIFWKRLGKGRLYDVPVQMGWLDTPTEESEMNPFPFFL